jgi:hypothetical protein
MRRRSRIWAWLAGGGLVVVAAAWGLSLVYAARWHDQRRSIFVGGGAVRMEWLPAGASMDVGDGWHLYRPLARVRVAWWPRHEKGRLLPSVDRNGMTVSWRTVFPTTIVLPMWPLGVVCLALLVIAIRRGRGPKPGHCRKCGYNLTGNVSGVCPECGEKASPQRPS